MKFLFLLSKALAVLAGALLTILALLVGASVIGRNLGVWTLVGDFELTASVAGAAIVTRRIALSVGDPNGIGPEIALKALAALKGEESIRITVFGPSQVLKKTAERLGLQTVLNGTELRTGA